MKYKMDLLKLWWSKNLYFLGLIAESAKFHVNYKRIIKENLIGKAQNEWGLNKSGGIFFWTTLSHSRHLH